MKKVLILSVALSAMMILMLQCGEDETTSSVSKIMGTVMLDTETIADGAIVTLSSQPNAADVIATTVSGADGDYSFMGVENGTYYLNARFDPANTNNMLKSASAVILTGSEMEVSVDGDTEKDIVMVGAVSSGTGMISMTDGVTFDVTHSTIGFEFPYDAVNAVFAGNFANVGVDAIEFDQSDPSAMIAKAWVDLTSVETGAPSGLCGHGRDGVTGCIQSTFKVELDPTDTVTVYCPDGGMNTAYPNTDEAAYDLWGDGSYTSYEKPSAIVGTSGAATFMVKSVMSYGTGYKAEADFTFAGTTVSVDFYFSYLEGYVGDTKEYYSIYGWFKFNPSAIGVTSGHIGDSDVTVKISAQFNVAMAV